MRAKVKDRDSVVKKVDSTEQALQIEGRRAVIMGLVNAQRVPSRILEEYIQSAVKKGARELYIYAYGQHGIGGRLWPTEEKICITVEGPVGQRLGSMGMFGTEIVVKNSVSDDVGWINCGAKITVLGDVTNGAFNAAAQGILYVQGGGGARCDTMTKRNPRFEPPQSWYFRDVGDSFAEFKAGGIAVVCGVNPRNPENVLGYRPCVGMVGGTIYFRGPIKEYSERDVKLLDLTEQDWQWLVENMRSYLEAIDRISYYDELTSSAEAWKKLVAYTPQEKRGRKWFKMSTSDFKREVWEKDIGKGGLFAEYVDHDFSVLPYITTGNERRVRPVWANEKYAPPCAYACPTHIPSHKRAALIRQGRLNEALELVLRYSPLPATVCGEICPNLCMQSCSRGSIDRPLRIDTMGSLSLNIGAPQKAPQTNKRVAVIGAGPAGMSAAWQLALKGHSVVLFEAADKMGGKLELCIPRERLPQEVLERERARFLELRIDVRLNSPIDNAALKGIYNDNDAVVIACGAHQPRMVSFPGSEYVVSAYDFLREINTGGRPDLNGKRVVIIGAGNVGMDVASEAYNMGAASVKAVDIQRPAAFGKEMEIAMSKGTEIFWPKFTERYDKEASRIHFKDGDFLEADMVIMSIGDIPKLDFIGPEVHTERGWISVNEYYQTTDPKVYAIGDVTGLGLVTHAIGHGRVAAENIHAQLMGLAMPKEFRQVIPYDRIRSEYYEACKANAPIEEEAGRCMSCATCRDCRMCETACYWGAISRVELPEGGYEYVVDDNRCIGCGFCAGICPCGVWEMVENL